MRKRKLGSVAGWVLAATLGVLFGMLLVVSCQAPGPEFVAGASSSAGFRDMVLAVTTDAQGVVTTNGESGISGRLYALEWVDGDMTDGVDITVTMQAGVSGVALTLFTGTNVNDDAWYFPRTQVHGATGTGLEYASGYNIVESPVLSGKPRILVGEGGATKTGSLILYWYR